jgi:hypothetical protein
MSGGFTAEGAAMPLALRGRLRHAARDALEWLLLPTVSAVMPWRWSFRLYRRVAQSDRLFGAATRSVLAAAAAWRPLAEPTAWAAAYRLVQLIDRADLWLSRFRSDRWIDRHLEFEGDAWPDRPFVGITFHYGAGLWAIRHLCRGGRRASFLSLRLERGFARGSLLQHAYARARLREVERAGRAPVIYTGGSFAEMRAALGRGVCILGLIDIPPGRAHSGMPVQFLGDRAWFPTGLLRLARIENAAVAVFTLGCDRATGKRKLHIRCLPAHDPVPPEDDEARLQIVARELEQAIDADPPAWHAWADLPLFRQAPAVRAPRDGDGDA